MIYREFLAGILAPLIVVSALLFAWRHRTTRAHWTGRFVLMGLLAVVAVCYTAPWDGWIIRNSVWTYPVGSIWGTIADVPIEEYLFMIGQTVFVGFWALTVLPATPMQAPTASQSWRRPVYCAAWLVAALIGGVAAALDTNALYLGSMLVWFGPPLALQAAVGADLLRAARRPRLTALSITVVLWFADLFAISSGAWQISTAHTTGIMLFGLPIEEALFFLVTTMLITNSFVLLSFPAARSRLRPRWHNARTYDHSTP